jgi:hypothetical protein
MKILTQTNVSDENKFDSLAWDSIKSHRWSVNIGFWGMGIWI